MSQPTSSVREFKAHDNLIRVAMLRQAGTIEKAVLEGVMNSVDAIEKAAAENLLGSLSEGRIVIEVKNAEISIHDNGRGFRTAEEVAENFETFGNPHEMDAEGCSTDARFGAFRIGRGQLFAFGHNTWRTGNFEMIVDLPRAKGLSYTLNEYPEVIAGCQITLKLDDYLMGSRMATVISQITEAVRYLDIPVTINGLRANPSEGRGFDIDNELFKANVKAAKGWSSKLRIYNQGVLVEELRGADYGLAGDLVTKVQIPLNTARNQVMRTSAAWKKIIAALVAASVKEVTAKEKVDMEVASSILKRLADGDMAEKQVAGIRFVFDVSGKAWSPNMLKRLAQGKDAFEPQPEIPPVGDCKPCVTFMEEGDRDGIHLTEARKCLALDVAMLKGHNDTKGQPLTPETLLRLVGMHSHIYKLLEPDVARTLLETTETTILAENLWTAREKRAIGLLDSVKWSFRAAEVEAYKRKLVVGLNDDLESWGDGKTYIAISRRALEIHRVESAVGRANLVLIMLAELARTPENCGAHTLDPDFLENYHHIATTGLADAMARVESGWVARESQDTKRAEREAAKEHEKAVKGRMN